MSKKLDLTGQRFTRLTVVREAPKNKHGHICWECLCDCGKTVITTTNQLRGGRIKSCGCYKKDNSSLDITGMKFGRLTALYIVGKYQRANVWRCHCDCGNEIDVVVSRLRNGTTKSCGCLLTEYLKDKRNDFTGFETEDILVVSRGDTLSTGSVPYVCKCKHCGNEFTVTDHALRQNCVHSCGCTYGSDLENEVYNFVHSIIPQEEILRNVPIFDDNKHEVDIWIPNKRIAIEVNGSLYHSSEGNPFTPKPHSYHQDKFIELKNRGIRLISIQDIFWGDKVKIILNNALLPHTRIMARKCNCELIDKHKANEFFDNFHVQGGNKNSRWHYGLYYNDNLVAVMSFGLSRYKADCIEIIRYAVLPMVTIVGGAEKLFKHFLADVKPSTVMTYSDNNYFLGGTYANLGFRFVKYTAPDYYWYKPHHGVLPREACQPQKLIKAFPNMYDKDAKSVEVDIMLKRKYKRVFMCGNTLWEYVNGGGE